MRLGISNIAWDVCDDDTVAGLLERFAIDAIDIAPGKYFPEPDKATNEDIIRVKKAWSDRGIEIAGMQSLLFGTTGLNMFGTPGTQNTMLRHLGHMCRIGAGLGATRLTFGSPKNRDRSGLDDQKTMEIAVPFFQHLGDIAHLHGAIICLEPNPTHYGANFLITSDDTAHMVKQVNHPAIRMQLDTGAITMNNENPDTVLQGCASLIGHVHASEPDLVMLGDGGTDHATFSKLLQQNLPKHIVTIEMLSPKGQPAAAVIERALKCAVYHYRPDRKVAV